MLWSGAEIKRDGGRGIAPGGGTSPARGTQGGDQVFIARGGLLNRGPWFTRSPPGEPHAASGRINAAE
jgi:hypothetical protein